MRFVVGLVLTASMIFGQFRAGAARRDITPQRWKAILDFSPRSLASRRFAPAAQAPHEPRGAQRQGAAITGTVFDIVADCPCALTTERMRASLTRPARFVRISFSSMSREAIPPP